MARTKQTARKTMGGGPNCPGCRRSHLKYLKTKRPSQELLSDRIVDQLKKLDEIDNALKSAVLPLQEEAEARQS